MTMRDPPSPPAPGDAPSATAEPRRRPTFEEPYCPSCGHEWSQHAIVCAGCQPSDGCGVWPKITAEWPSPSASSASVPAEEIRALADTLQAKADGPLIMSGDLDAGSRAAYAEAAHALRALLARHGDPAAKEPAR